MDENTKGCACTPVLFKDSVVKHWSLKSAHLIFLSPPRHPTAITTKCSILYSPIHHTVPHSCSEKKQKKTFIVSENETMLEVLKQTDTADQTRDWFKTSGEMEDCCTSTVPECYWWATIRVGYLPNFWPPKHTADMMLGNDAVSDWGLYVHRTWDAEDLCWFRDDKEDMLCFWTLE